MTRIVVSLSTIPSRVANLEQTLMSLAVQTRKPDVVYVSVPKVSDREGVSYPIKMIAKQIKRVLPGIGRVAVLEEDYGPLTKLMGPLMGESDPKTLIITVDDDQKYDERLVETLVAGSEKHPGSVVCLCGHVIGRFPNMWAFRCSRGDVKWPLKMIYLEPDTPVDIVSGWCGVLYPRGVFGDEVPHPAMEDLRKNKLKILNRHDDLLVSAWLDLLDVNKYVVAYSGAHKDLQLEHASHNALSTGSSGATPLAGIKHTKEFWSVIRVLRSRGLLCSGIRVKWYKSTITLAGIASVATIVVFAGLVVWTYRSYAKRVILNDGTFI